MQARVLVVANIACLSGIDGVVFAYADILAWVPFRAWEDSVSIRMDRMFEHGLEMYLFA